MGFTKGTVIGVVLLCPLFCYSQTFTQTINLDVTSNYGGDYPTDNSYYTNVLAIGGVGAEKGLKIYKQNPGNSASFIGPNTYNDSYVFEMTDSNGGDPDGGILFGGTGSDDVFESIMVIRGNGRVGIGTNNPDQKLSVNGTIRSKEIKVESSSWPDYVFNPSYPLLALSDLKVFITENHHLPKVPSANEVEVNGIALGEMNALLLEKIEELTLHLIEEHERNNDLQAKVDFLMKEYQNLKEKLENQ